MTIQETDFAAKVAHGATMFDAVFGSNWDELIDTSDFDISNVATCALAQVASQHRLFKAAVAADLKKVTENVMGVEGETEPSDFCSGWHICFPSADCAEIFAMGCAIDKTFLTDDEEAAIYEHLTIAWLEEIARRRKVRHDKASADGQVRKLEDA